MKCSRSTILSFCFSLILTVSAFAQCQVDVVVNTSSCDTSTNFYSANINIEISDPPNSGLVIIYHEGFTHVEDLSSFNVDPIQIVISVPFLMSSGQNRTVHVTFPDQSSSCNDTFT